MKISPRCGVFPLVNSAKIDDDGEVTDFGNENDFKTLFYFIFVFRAFGYKPSSVN